SSAISVTQAKNASPADPVPSPKLSISGRITDIGGKPLANAQVGLVSRTIDKTGKDLGDELLTQKMADEHGRFSFEVPSASLSRSWGFIGVARTNGRAIGWREVKAEAGTVSAEIALLSGQTIRGRVLDLQGWPVAGAKVTVSSVGTDVNGIPEGIR